MPYLNLTDAELVKAYKSGDENALSELIKRHQSKIFGFIYSKVSDSDLADDLFQETFIKVIRIIRGNIGYNEEGKFSSWVTRIAHNLIIDYYRRQSKVKQINSTNNLYDKDYFVEQNNNVEEDMIDLQISRDLIKMVEQLPDDQKEVIKMRIYEDLSFKEIADITNVSINTALGRMRYAVINLRKLAEKHQIILTN